MIEPAGMRPAEAVDLTDPAFVVNSSFFALARAIERYLWDRELGPQDPKARFAQIHFRSRPSLEFPVSEVTKVEEGITDGKLNWRIELACWGFLGGTGALPPHMTAIAQDFGDQDRSSFREFFALFEDRSAQLRYLAEEKASWLYSYESHREFPSEGSSDPFTGLLSSLIGFGHWGSANKGFRFPPDFARRHAGSYAGLRRPAAQIQRILSAYLGADVSIVENYGVWQNISLELQTTLGKHPDDRYPEQDTQNSRLGVSACAGQRVWTCQQSLLVQLGPLDRDVFEALLPTGELFGAVADLVRLYVGTSYDFFLQPILKQKDVPFFKLGAEGTKLGWNTWAVTSPPTQPARDCILAAPSKLPET